MNDAETTPGTARSTDQIANAGPSTQDEARLDQYAETPAEQAAPAQPTMPGGTTGSGGQLNAQLLEDDELQHIRAQWKDIQADFVDEPRTAVQDADALVAELMQRLAQMFASEREALESRWSGGGDVSTEELRDGLRRYRSFFERLLAA